MMLTLSLARSDDCGRVLEVGLVGTIAGPINSKLSFPVRVSQEGLPPKINIKSSNLAAAEDILSDEL